MRPARGRIIKTSNVRVRVVLIGESRKTVAAKARDTEVVVITKAVKRLQVLRDLEVSARAAQPFVEWDAEGFSELREGRHVSELLAVLIVMLVLEVPEPFVLDEISTCASTAHLAVERRLIL